MSEISSKLGRVLNRRNIVISALLFLIVVVQLIVLMPRDIEPLDLRPEDVIQAEKKERKAENGKGGPLTAAPTNALSDSIPSGQIVRNAMMVDANEDGKELELWADRAVRPKDREEWTLDDVRAKFYASNGVIYTVTGKNGGVTLPGYSLWVKGNVVTKSSNGYTFKSESVFYDPKIKRLIAPTKITMDGPPDTDGSRLYLDGEDMVADMTTNQLNVNRNVRARRLVAGPGGEKKTAQIQSNSAVFSGKSNLAVFKGQVIIDFETMRLTGPEAKFSYDPRMQNLESMLVSGGVRVTDSDKSATSGSVAVFFKDDKYVFKGSPRVIQQQDELIGDEIVFLRGGKQVQVINAKAQVDPSRTQVPDQTPKGTRQ